MVLRVKIDSIKFIRKFGCWQKVAQKGEKMIKIIIFFMLVGVGMFSYSLYLPYYTDQNAKEKLENKNEEMNFSGENYIKYKENYYAEIEKIKTNKISLMDIGTGIVIASITILIFLYKQNIKKTGDFKKLNSMNKNSIYIYANLIWLILIPGTIWYYTFRGMRGDYPWFADSIGIPLMQSISVFVIALLPLNLFIFLTTWKSKFPAKLIELRTEYNWKAILNEIFWGFWILLNLLILISFIIDGDHISIPVNLFFTYVLLNLRSGQIENIKETVLIKTRPSANKILAQSNET